MRGGTRCPQCAVHRQRIGVDIDARLVGKTQLIRVAAPDCRLSALDHRQVFAITVGPPHGRGVPPARLSGAQRRRARVGAGRAKRVQNGHGVLAPLTEFAAPFFRKGHQRHSARLVVEHHDPVGVQQRRIRMPAVARHCHAHRLRAPFVAEPTDPAEPKAGRGRPRLNLLWIAGQLGAQKLQNRFVLAGSERPRRGPHVALAARGTDTAVEPEAIPVVAVEGGKDDFRVDPPPVHSCQDASAHTLTLWSRSPPSSGTQAGLNRRTTASTRRSRPRIPGWSQRERLWPSDCTGHDSSPP